MNERKLKIEGRREKLSFEEAFQQLQKILQVLKELGLTVPEYCYSSEKIKEDWDLKYAFPIAREGMDGIRAKRLPNGNFQIFFTNAFESPDNPKRLEITKKLRAKGFDVV